MELLRDRDPSRYGMKTVVHAKIDSHQPRISHPEHEVVPVRSAHVRHHLKPAISVQLLPHPLPHLALHKAMVPQIDHTQSAEARSLLENFYDVVDSLSKRIVQKTT